MSFRVRLTRNAAADFEQRLTTVAERSPETARRLNDRFEKALLRLRDFPLACGLAYENPSFSEELRNGP
jgi:plasmid stabilization system protein ParE